MVVGNMGEWKEYKLGEVAVFSQGIQVGIEKQIETCKEGYVRFIRIVDYTKGTDAPRYILYPGARYMVDETDIVMMRYGTPGKVARGYSGAIANNMFKITVNEDFLNKDYIFYYLSQDSVYRTLVASNSSSTMPAINFKIIEGLDISAPSISKQMRIVSILKSLDDKIEVNRKINENLEQQAQALFKSWFVDFEPFKNGEFVESELGMIPKGWRVGKLSEIADVNPYRNLKKGINALYLDMKNMPTKGSFPMNWDYKLYSGGMKFKNEDTLMARITPCLENGKVAYVNFLEDDEIAFGSTEYIVMTPKDGFMPELLYFLCRDDFFKGYATKNMNGSSGRQRVSAETIGKYPIAIPPKVQIESIASYYKGIMDNVKKNGLESRRLASLRDTLLPKLMSGELKVNEL